MNKTSIFAVFLLVAAPALAGTPAKVLSIYDGDTFTAEIAIAPWADIVQRTPVRIRGIDAPEMKGLGRDKYGRLLARVTANGQDIGAAMLRLGLARAYDGGKRAGWC